MSWSQHRPRHDRYVRTGRAFLFWTPQGPHADWTSSARGAQSIGRDHRCPNYRARAKVVVGREPWSRIIPRADMKYNRPSTETAGAGRLLGGREQRTRALWWTPAKP